jgi:hypothetical protein
MNFPLITHLLDKNFTMDDFMSVFLIFLFFVIAYNIVRWLYKLNKDKNNTIYFVDLITVNGRLNERKVCRFGAWLISTWGFMFLILNNQLSEWYFVGYMGAWVANALIGKAIKDPNGEEFPTPKEDK